MPITRDNNKFYMDEGYAINHLKDGCAIGKHTHDFIEFSYVYHGKCTHIIDGEEYNVCGGDLLLINCGSVHEIRCDGRFEYADILIKPEFVDESMRGEGNAFSLLALKDFNELQSAVKAEKQIVHFSGEEKKSIEELIQWSETELYGKMSGNTLILKSCMNIFLTYAFRKMALPMSGEFKMDDELLKYIRKNCGNRLPLDYVAAKCNYNPTYFSRLFKKYTGKTFKTYLTEARLDRAAELLKGTDIKVEDIMVKCGMSDRSKFFKNFASRFGVTPAKFRDM